MLGYWLGAMLMSVTLGLVIVFALEGSSVVQTTQNTLSPAANFVLVGFNVGPRHRAHHWPRQVAHRTEQESDAWRTPKRQKEPPIWQQQLSKGTAKATFVIGALLTLPGATYLVALNKLSKLDYPTSVTVLVVVVFNLVQLLLVEIPMVAVKVAPSQTPILIDNAKEDGLDCTDGR